MNDKKIKVLHFVADITVGNGVMNVVMNYAEALKDEATFSVMYFSTPKLITEEEHIESLNGKAYRVNSPGLNRKFIGDFKKILKENKFDVLHIHLPYLCWLVVPIARKMGIKNIIVHSHTGIYSLSGSSIRNFLNRCMNIPTRFIKIKRLAASELAGKVWFGKNYKVLHNAIDVKKYVYDENRRVEIRQKYGVSQDALALVHIGKTNIPAKNHTFILKVFGEVVKKNGNAVLFLIGGKKTEHLDELARELNIQDKIFYLGIQKDITGFLSASDSFLFPSTSEGLLIAAVECEANGIKGLVSKEVPIEVLITDKVKAYSLEESPQKWAEYLLNVKNDNKERITDNSIVKNAGWDAKDNAKLLLQAYR